MKIKIIKRQSLNTSGSDPARIETAAKQKPNAWLNDALVSIRQAKEREARQFFEVRRQTL